MVLKVHVHKWHGVLEPLRILHHKDEIPILPKLDISAGYKYFIVCPYLMLHPSQYLPNFYPVQKLNTNFGFTPESGQNIAEAIDKDRPHETRARNKRVLPLALTGDVIQQFGVHELTKRESVDGRSEALIFLEVFLQEGNVAGRGEYIWLSVRQEND